jgi:signal recognition particle subunit SRP54
MLDFLSEKFSSIFSKLKPNSKLTESNIKDIIENINDTLIEADVPYDVVEEFIKEIKDEFIGKKVIRSLQPAEFLIKVVHTKLLEFLGSQTENTTFSFQIPSTIMLLGLQGAGKTTTAAKLAYFLKSNAEKKGKKRNIMLASVDFYRPAAIDQLQLMAEKSNVTFYRSKFNNPIEATKDIYKQAHQQAIDYLILDTAGRLHIDKDMIDELKEINNIIKPKYKILVIDAMTGQESLNVALEFEKNLDITGSIITKMDSQARSGLIFGFKYKVKKPIIFLTTGEKIEDIELFKPERIANRILGMGDIATLLEKANEKISESDQNRIYNNISKGNITLEDFAEQINMINKLGSLVSIAKYIPGFRSLNISNDILEQGQKELLKYKDIINSMTLKERINPNILDNSRKLRIAKGSGVSTNQVDMLLKKFEESKVLLKNILKLQKR